MVKRTRAYARPQEMPYFINTSNALDILDREESMYLAPDPKSIIESHQNGVPYLKDGNIPANMNSSFSGGSNGYYLDSFFFEENSLVNNSLIPIENLKKYKRYKSEEHQDTNTKPKKYMDKAVNETLKRCLDINIGECRIDIDNEYTSFPSRDRHTKGRIYARSSRYFTGRSNCDSCDSINRYGTMNISSTSYDISTHNNKGIKRYCQEPNYVKQYDKHCLFKNNRIKVCQQQYSRTKLELQDTYFPMYVKRKIFPVQNTISPIYLLDDKLDSVAETYYYHSINKNDDINNGIKLAFLYESFYSHVDHGIQISPRISRLFRKFMGFDLVTITISYIYFHKIKKHYRSSEEVFFSVFLSCIFISIKYKDDYTIYNSKAFQGWYNETDTVNTMEVAILGYLQYNLEIEDEVIDEMIEKIRRVYI